MSVVMSLLKPSDTVCIGENPSELIGLSWSDHEYHDYIDFSDLRTCYKKCRFWKRIANKFEGLPYSIYVDSIYHNKHIVLAVDQVEYAQGWFFKRRYFKRKDWYNVCNSKKGMINFFNRYIDYSDKDVREIVNRFINAWEDGMIFECCW